MRILIILISSCALLTILVVVMNLDIDAPKRGATSIQIADKNFIIPAEFNYWKYSQKSSEEKGPYNQFEFTLDINSFKPIKPKYQSSSNFLVEVRPLATEFGEKKYWTKDDPVYNTKPKNCIDKNIDGIGYILCEHGKKVPLISWGDNFYSLRKKNSSDYISLIGCMDPAQHKNLYPICNGRAKLLGNIQIEYGYNASHFSEAIKLDHTIRKMVSEMQSIKNN